MSTPEPDRLSADIHLVGDLLGRVIRRLAGDKGADLWHLASALFLAPEGKDLTFLTLDRAQKIVAARLGFEV